MELELLFTSLRSEQSLVVINASWEHSKAQDQAAYSHGNTSLETATIVVVPDAPHEEWHQQAEKSCNFLLTVSCGIHVSVLILY